jgi:hypothetical protein
MSDLSSYISSLDGFLNKKFESSFDLRFIQKKEKVGSIEKLISSPIYQLNPQKILEVKFSDSNLFLELSK